MQLIKQFDLVKSEGPILCSFDAAGADYIKIYGSGELTSAGGDRRFYLRVNGMDAYYKSYIQMAGDDGQFEWDTSGFYVGRNSCAKNADFFIEYTLGSKSISNSIVGAGLSTFSNSDNVLVGMECHGRLYANTGFGDITLCTTGGVVTASITAYKY